jgi:D-alanyl-lipoteichoic acid acyltransferase DltB (MBOAT superfamily)
VLNVALNLLSLGVFKYADFALELGAASTGLSFEPLGIILPLGISFFTFHLIAYAVDVHRGLIPHEKSLTTFALFVSFFPQLIAGPICRGRQLLPQLKEKQILSIAALTQGMLMLSAGYFIKAGLADNLAPFVDKVYGDVAAANPQTATLATAGFTMQILFDFWGYSTMALGSAWLFGIMLPVNFNLPYVAASLQDVWRRWHMTLSFWLRDYLYVGLGGNRKGAVRTYFNLLAVMLLGGLWHGAAITFVVWGFIHGAVLALERLAGSLLGLLGRTASLIAAILAPARWLLTMAIVVIAWVFFRAGTVQEAFSLLSLIKTGIMTPVATFDYSQSEELRIVAWFVCASLVAMVPIHLLNMMGSNQNFYRPENVWRSSVMDADGFEKARPVQPIGQIAVGRLRLPFPNEVKVILAVWLFIGGYTLSSGATTPFIYFQF